MGVAFFPQFSGISAIVHYALRLFESPGQDIEIANIIRSIKIRSWKCDSVSLQAWDDRHKRRATGFHCLKVLTNGTLQFMSPSVNVFELSQAPS